MTPKTFGSAVAGGAPLLRRSGVDRVKTRRSVLSLARAIEPDWRAVLRWYDNVGIHELWGRTARELVEAGHGRRVLGFLAEVATGRRD